MSADGLCVATREVDMVGTGRVRRRSSELVADAIAALALSGCPTCRYVDAAVEKFFTWFAMENYAEAATLARLRASLGMCPPHTRRVLAQPGAAGRLSGVYRQVLPAARALLDADDPAVEVCPACATGEAACRYSLRWMMTALGEQAVGRVYAEADGLCVPHLLAALPTDAERGRLLVQTALARLTNPPGLGPLAGWDRDAGIRAALRASLPAEALPPAHRDHHLGTVDRLCARLALGACPLCLAAGQAERSYLDWVCAAYLAEGADLVGNQPGTVCPRHLYDLAELQPRVVGWALVHAAKRRTAQLAPVRDRLDAVPPRRLRARIHHARASDDDGARPHRLRQLLASRSARTTAAYRGLEPDVCMVCRAVHQHHAGETELLLAALELPSVAREYEAAHGLCVRHVLALPRQDPRARLPRAMAAAWTGVLGAELAEADRKLAWLGRHEAAGGEDSAWLRAAALLDGETFLGGPARAW